MKYIVFMPKFNATRRLFDDIKKRTDVYCYDDIMKSSFYLKVIQKLNSYINGIERCKFWLFFTNKNFMKNKKEKLVFLYLNSNVANIAMNIGFVDYCKRRYPNSKQVVFFLDVHDARRNNVLKMKNTFDLLLIFDEIEAKKMGIEYYPTPYSKISIKKVNKVSSDIYFVGQAKSRYYDLIKVFEFCEKNGIKSDFNIIGVPKENQRYPDKINYIDFIPYEKTLEIVSNSNCALELLLDDVTSYSIRVYEALVNNKKIITNNPQLLNTSFYDEKIIHFFKDINDVDPNFIKERSPCKKKYNGEFSPVKLLEYLKTLYLD